ncbi:MAG: hypothetical protein J6B87_02750 [Clostridia bacterium]|nr:hypothetical protein [Clostridia bacterium]
MQEEFIYTIPEERETIINIIYSESYVDVYTSHKNVYKRLCESLGEPQKKYPQENKISGGAWRIPFEDKKTINQALSRPILIGDIT